MNNGNKKLFIVRKYIFARNAKDAIKLDSKYPPDDVYVDSDWQKENMYKNDKQVGF